MRVVDATLPLVLQHHLRVGWIEPGAGSLKLEEGWLSKKPNKSEWPNDCRCTFASHDAILNFHTRLIKWAGITALQQGSVFGFVGWFRKHL